MHHPLNLKDLKTINKIDTNLKKSCNPCLLIKLNSLALNLSQEFNLDYNQHPNSLVSLSSPKLQLSLRTSRWNKENKKSKEELTNKRDCKLRTNRRTQIYLNGVA